MEYFSLLEFPEDIQALVVERVACNSICDLYCIRETSKWMKALADRRRVYHFFDVLSVPWGLNAGYERAVYLHAITRVVYWSDGQYMSRIPRESAERMGKLVRSVKWGWILWHRNDFHENSELFDSSYLPSFYSCKCGNLIERSWNCLWQIDISKDDSMCNRCFWIKELGCFFRDFQPMAMFRDTTRW
ncbi:hypothetical protein Bca52824_017008 [Brassica carinata]|uniref:F-box domain-containing protein n=1 Tax=Brassica carinata TaxID=52824 RepID=A0A8X7VM97_BRACI|nr:hypothetical protein Bca52824_017008 [Brassica carinata]